MNVIKLHWINCDKRLCVKNNYVLRKVTLQKEIHSMFGGSQKSLNISKGKSIHCLRNRFVKRMKEPNISQDRILKYLKLALFNIIVIRKMKAEEKGFLKDNFKVKTSKRSFWTQIALATVPNILIKLQVLKLIYLTRRIMTVEFPRKLQVNWQGFFNKESSIWSMCKMTMKTRHPL